MLKKYICLVVLFILHFSYAQKTHELNTNSCLSEIFISKVFKSPETKNIVEMIDYPYIDDEGLFNNKKNIHDGQVIQSADEIFDINLFLDDTAYAVVYGYFEISSKKEENVNFLFSTTDGVKLFVNNNYQHAYAGNTFSSIEEYISVPLNKGINRVVLKMPNKDWDWKIKVKILNDEDSKEYLKQKYEAIEYHQFLNIDVIPLLNLKSDWTHNMMLYMRIGNFPEFALDKPELAKKYLGGGYEIKVRWFDTNLNEVFYPKETGRYGYYAEIKGKNGDILKRSGTLLCTSENWTAWASFLNAHLDYLPVNDISRQTWNDHREAAGNFLGLKTFESFLMQKEQILYLCFLDDMQKKGLKPNRKLTPLIYDGDFHSKIKQIILGKENYYIDLKFPGKIFSGNDKFEYLKPKKKKKYSRFTKKMDKICKDWIDDGGSPFDMIIAKDGKIIYHEAFGSDDFGVFTINTPTEIASITKLFTGILFAQFVEQNMIGIDDPVGKYLPEFPTEGPQAITMRHLFTHTGGFYGHGLYDGVHNHWLENTLYHVIKNDTVGTSYRYNGTSYELAGKVMELVTGKSVFRLFQEYLYEPLGMDNTYHQWSLGYSVHTTAYDLAILGQMLLQRGVYNGKKYFSEETFKSLLPIDLNQFYPGIRFNNAWDKDQARGIGIVMQNWKTDDKITGKKRYLLSDNVIGHGSATSSVLRIDLDNNILITQTRRRGKANFGKHFKNVYELIDETLINKE